MAFSAMLRQSSSSLAPLIGRLFSGQRTFSHQCLLIAANHTRKIISNRSFFVPSVSRNFSSASLALNRPSSDESLLRVIESEITCSEESFEEKEDFPASFPFQLNDNLGQQTLSLTREYGGETIHVEVEPSGLDTTEDDDSDDNSDESSEKISLPMVVKVSKTDAPSLEFGITAYPDEIVIDTLVVKDPDLPEDQLPYEGPRFDELDENLQKEFHNYLEVRGIKASATSFLHEYMVNKEHREYTNWLKNLKKFVEA